jgi:hypothetical protein
MLACVSVSIERRPILPRGKKRVHQQSYRHAGGATPMLRPMVATTAVVDLLIIQVEGEEGIHRDTKALFS